MRSNDGALERAEETYGVRLGGVDRYGNERLHYPDLLLIDPHGRRLALELELTGKGREKREGIIGADGRIDRVLYLVEAQPAGWPVQRALEATAWNMGLSDRVHVQPIKPLHSAGDEGRQETGRRASRVRRRATPTARRATPTARRATPPPRRTMSSPRRATPSPQHPTSAREPEEASR
jgi:hypothetical protein